MFWCKRNSYYNYNTQDIQQCWLQCNLYCAREQMMRLQHTENRTARKYLWIVNIFCQTYICKMLGAEWLELLGNFICQYSDCNKQHHTRHIQMVEAAMQEQMMRLQCTLWYNTVHCCVSHWIYSDAMREQMMRRSVGPSCKSFNVNHTTLFHSGRLSSCQLWSFDFEFLIFLSRPLFCHITLF